MKSFVTYSINSPNRNNQRNNKIKGTMPNNKCNTIKNNQNINKYLISQPKILSNISKDNNQNKTIKKTKSQNISKNNQNIYSYVNYEQSNNNQNKKEQSKYLNSPPLHYYYCENNISILNNSKCDNDPCFNDEIEEMKKNIRNIVKMNRSECNNKIIRINTNQDNLNNNNYQNNNYHISVNTNNYISNKNDLDNNNNICNNKISENILLTKCKNEIASKDIEINSLKKENEYLNNKIQNLMNNNYIIQNSDNYQNITERQNYNKQNNFNRNYQNNDNNFLKNKVNELENERNKYKNKYENLLSKYNFLKDNNDMVNKKNS